MMFLRTSIETLAYAGFHTISTNRCLNFVVLKVNINAEIEQHIDTYQPILKIEMTIFIHHRSKRSDRYCACAGSHHTFFSIYRLNVESQLRVVDGGKRGSQQRGPHR